MRAVSLEVISGLFLLTGCAPEPASVGFAGSTEDVAGTAQERPNLLVLVADDMGYTDLGVFGSEIATPALDGLAARSITFTDFHVLPMCAPTRSVLLSGADNHTAGLGAMFGGTMLTHSAIHLSAIMAPTHHNLITRMLPVCEVRLDRHVSQQTHDCDKFYVERAGCTFTEKRAR